MNLALIPEWQSSEAVILAWPHEATDWAPWLESARQTYLSLIQHINDSQAGVILLCRESDMADITQRLVADARVLLVGADYNDTWARDFTFLSCGEPNAPYPVEFIFNGWGNKFDASLDNQINQRYLAPLCQQPLRSVSIVAEGGALEIDDSGHLLSTASCLFNPERNGTMSEEEYRAVFAERLGCSDMTILANGHLEGDDTDGHIDTLVRFTPAGGLVIQAAENRPQDSHYEGLSALVSECRQQFPEHTLHLLPLPAMYNGDGERLPASYANYLVCNRSVLLPVYDQPEDAEAVQVMQSAFPEHQIVPVNCATLVQQYGSLHCITMQVPTNTLTTDVIQQLHSGVTRYV
ncbi:agmatine deiminase family protein [Alteromonas gilva]|uniref:Agmatine deiminase family protein n=1 Tax=Alteromonas gilva TaxID=2987522 RepID=A0ABT5KYP9_9ALTE|nr:agmatine deiminase family protein [Alteromonas gilva]MDC8829891.1 agmatine deiminase family protein [Alteromonas gilva]